MFIDVVSQRYDGHAVALASREENREHDDGHDSRPKRRNTEVPHAVPDNVDSGEGEGGGGGKGNGGGGGASRISASAKTTTLCR